METVSTVRSNLIEYLPISIGSTAMGTPNYLIGHVMSNDYDSCVIALDGGTIVPLEAVMIACTARNENILTLLLSRSSVKWREHPIIQTSLSSFSIYTRVSLNDHRKYGPRWFTFVMTARAGCTILTLVGLMVGIVYFVNWRESR